MQVGLKKRQDYHMTPQSHSWAYIQEKIHCLKGIGDSQVVWYGHVHTDIFKMDKQQEHAHGTLLNVRWQPG